MSINKKNVLFIIMQFNFGPFYFSRMYVPHNIKLLATILKKRGHNVSFCNEKRLDKVDIDSVDVVCLSAIDENVSKAYKIADFFRSRNKKVIMGGVHVSMLPEEAKGHADHVVIGEADLIICDVVEGRRREKIVHGKRMDNLDELPFIDRGITREKKWFEMSTSRGCPHNCSFCTVVKMLGNKYRARTPENVIREMENFKDPRTIFLIDDNFAFNGNRAKEILKMIKDRGINSSFITQTTINIYKDDELLKLLGDLDFSVLIGIENTSREALKALNKRQNFVDIKKAIKTINDHGVKVNSAFIMGSDADDSRSIDKNIDEFTSLDVDGIIPTIMIPFAGSDTYNTLEREGRIITKDWDRYTGAFVTYSPKKMKAYELQKKFLDSWGRFYSIKRIKNIIRTHLTKFHFDYDAGEKISILPTAINHEYLSRKAIQEYTEYLEKKDI